MTPRARCLSLAAALAALGCAGAPRTTEPAPGAVALPREASRSPDGGPGFEVPIAAYVSERNRCIDRELAQRELNDFGDPVGTSYPDGMPLEVTKGVDRYDYVMRRNRGIATACSRAPGSGDR
jgi:hypothetical protein